LFEKRNNLDEFINIPTKAEKKKKIYDPNFVEDPRSELQQTLLDWHYLVDLYN